MSVSGFESADLGRGRLASAAGRWGLASERFEGARPSSRPPVTRAIRGRPKSGRGNSTSHHAKRVLMHLAAALAGAGLFVQAGALEQLAADRLSSAKLSAARAQCQELSRADVGDVTKIETNRSAPGNKPAAFNEARRVTPSLSRSLLLLSLNGGGGRGRGNESTRLKRRTKRDNGPAAGPIDNYSVEEVSDRNGTSAGTGSRLAAAPLLQPMSLSSANGLLAPASGAQSKRREVSSGVTEPDRVRRSDELTAQTATVSASADYYADGDENASTGLALDEFEPETGGDANSPLAVSQNEFLVYQPNMSWTPSESDGKLLKLDEEGEDQPRRTQPAAKTATNAPLAERKPAKVGPGQNATQSEVSSTKEQGQRARGRESVDLSQAGGRATAADNQADGSQRPRQKQLRPQLASAKQYVGNAADRPTQFCVGQREPGQFFGWTCSGYQLIRIPSRLEPKPTRLRLSNFGIETLSAESLLPYRETLRDFSIENGPRLSTIERNAFANFTRLRVVYIFQAPRLVSFDFSIVGRHKELALIRIQQTGLRAWPNLSEFKQERLLTIDLDNNKIETLGPAPINIQAEVVNLEFNHLTSIEEHTFNGSEIGTLSLSGNRQLTFIHMNAFANLKNLITLDLSGTSLTQLPTNGLHQLRQLKIQDNYALKQIPSIFVFPKLEEALLTYSYHCCSFRYPQTHDPSAYEEHIRLQNEINAICSKQSQAVTDAGVSDAASAAISRANARDTLVLERFEIAKRESLVGNGAEEVRAQNADERATQTTEAEPIDLRSFSATSTPSSDFEGSFFEAGPQQQQHELHVHPQQPMPTGGQHESATKMVTFSGTTTRMPTLTGSISVSWTPETVSKLSSMGRNQSSTDELGLPDGRHVSVLAASNLPANFASANSFFSGSESTPASGGPVTGGLKKQWLLHNIECGELVLKQSGYQNISCTPEPDAFNPCEDIMGYQVLRVAVWLVVACSTLGNMSVIVVLLGIFKRLSVPKFLQLNLAIGDLFMGVYLAMLAAADLTTAGTYFNFALDWQHGLGCRLAGASSLFASQLSIFTLIVITFERYYTITYSIDLNMRLQLGWAAKIMLIGWLYAFASAMLPVFGDINSYSKTSICLPMRTTYKWDRVFIMVLLAVDSCAFLIIFICYLKMYLLVLKQKTEASLKERTVAMRMALLVLTDFACWAPIIFFGATAVFGYPLISVTNSKILIVFFYPLNSMANPFLYVLSTRQYRRDLHYVISRWRHWRKNLFRSASDKDYSFNQQNAYGKYPQQIAMSAHLNAVAAVTGVANHLHGYRIPIGAGGVRGGYEMDDGSGSVDAPLARNQNHRHHQLVELIKLNPDDCEQFVDQQIDCHTNHKCRRRRHCHHRHNKHTKHQHCRHHNQCKLQCENEIEQGVEVQLKGADNNVQLVNNGNARYIIRHKILAAKVAGESHLSHRRKRRQPFVGRECEQAESNGQQMDKKPMLEALATGNAVVKLGHVIDDNERVSSLNDDENCEGQGNSLKQAHELVHAESSDSKLVLVDSDLELGGQMVGSLQKLSQTKKSRLEVVDLRPNKRPHAHRHRKRHHHHHHHSHTHRNNVSNHGKQFDVVSNGVASYEHLEAVTQACKCQSARSSKSSSRSAPVFSGIETETNPYEPSKQAN